MVGSEVDSSGSMHSIMIKHILGTYYYLYTSSYAADVPVIWDDRIALYFPPRPVRQIPFFNLQFYTSVA